MNIRSSIRDIAAATFRRPPKVIAALPFAFVAAFGAPQASAEIATGTVMVSTGNGKVTEFSQTGFVGAQLDTGTGASTQGSVFDSAGNFYVTDFAAQCVTKFDPTGFLIGPFGGPYYEFPESIIVDAHGFFYVGQEGVAGPTVLKFLPNGTQIEQFAPLGFLGAKWIELGSDQCTLFYTSEEAAVKRFNVCTNTQLSDFNVAPLPDLAFALRLLPSGGMLVADASAVIRLDASGNQVQTYSLAGLASDLFALSLDPDGTSFWTGATGGQVYKVDIASGSVLQSWSANGAPGFSFLGGLSVKGEIITSQPRNKCPLGQGYWKNHPNAWPVTSLALRIQTYTKAQLLAILKTPAGGDASLILADQLIAAKLNIANGSNPAPVSATIADADSLLSGFLGELPYNVSPSSTIGQKMVNDASTLDSYNNDALTPTCTK